MFTSFGLFLRSQTHTGRNEHMIWRRGIDNLIWTEFLSCQALTQARDKWSVNTLLWWKSGYEVYIRMSHRTCVYSLCIILFTASDAAFSFSHHWWTKCDHLIIYVTCPIDAWLIDALLSIICWITRGHSVCHYFCGDRSLL